MTKIVISHKSKIDNDCPSQGVRNYKRESFAIFSVFYLLSFILTACAVAAPLPNGDTQTELIDDYKVKIGLQHRVMWNSSNIPISGVTTAADTKKYDFFRQRLRFNLDIQPSDKVGGFLQLEYRGGWGGSSPVGSDPRGTGLSLNAFNRLQARGVRYGYIYYTPDDNTCLASGIIPVSDQIGDVLFSADWDFNVGGISFNSMAGRADYRVAFVRLIDGVSSTDKNVVSNNGDMLIADVNWPVSETAKIGVHLYHLSVPEELAIEAGLPGKISQGWYALSGSVEIKSTNLNSFLCINNGSFDGEENTGWALKTESTIPLGAPHLSVLGIYSSGDKSGASSKNQFRTVQGMLGTEGYWAYCHIFNANGPSDVNDMGVGLDNDGRGLLSFQTKCEIPLSKKLNSDLVAGWFRASEENADGNSEMGTEISGMLTYEMAKYLNFQIGAAYAFLGKYYITNDRNPDEVGEIFTRFQLQF